MENPKIVCTLTSWTKRINYVSKFLINFFSTQTQKPDIFYIWLSEEEFQNKENDLPKDFLESCQKYNIKLMWLKENEYCHKRWYVYPTHFNDIVIGIDDDQFYDNHLVEWSKTLKNEKAIYNLHPKMRGIHKYTGIVRTQERILSNTPLHERSLCGQCIIPPKCFPLDCITNDMINLRKKICPRCDESWIKPFIVKNDIKVATLQQFNHHILNGETEKDATWREMNKTFQGYQKRDLQMYYVLKKIPILYETWIKHFPSYNDSNIKISDAEILKFLLCR